MDGNNSPETEKLISAFTEITSSSIKVAISFLGTHEWNFNAAVSNFFEANDSNPSENELLRRDPIEIPDSSSSSSDDSLPPLLLVRSRSPSDPSRFHYCFRPKLPGEDPFGCRTIKRRRYRRKVDYLSDEAKEYYEEGDKSDTVLEKANESAMERPIQSSRSMSGETVSAEIQEEKLQDQSHDAVTSNSITSLESPRAFDGTRRTLAGSDSVSTEPPLTTTPPLSMGVPTTLIQIRLADGTRLVSRFNTHHTVRDVRGFIDVTRPDDSKDYQLFTMGFPPKPLPDLDQTIDKACISNSVLIQKY